VQRTYSDGDVTHVTGIITITADEFASRVIKHNKDLLEYVEDTDAAMEKLQLY